MIGFSFLESIFAWAMIAGGLAILVGVRWRPMKLWHSQRRNGLRSLLGHGDRKNKRTSAP